MWGPFKRIKQTDEKYPDKFIFASEACFGSVPTVPPFTTKGPVLGSWHRGEIYAYDILNDLNAGVTGWNDWNLALDMQGGPSWAKNYVDAPILIDTDKKNVYYKQPMFFFMGHFSKFLPRDSVRVETEYSNPGFAGNLGMGFEPYITSFVRPDGHLVVTVLNMGFWTKEYQLKVGQKVFTHSIDKHSIQTVLIKLDK